MAREEFLRRAGALEALHLALSPSGRPMRILGAMVLPSPAFVAALDPEIVGRGAVRSQVVGDQLLGSEAVTLQKLSHQFQRGVLVSLGLDRHVENLVFGVDGAPQIDHSAIDFQIDLVKTPSRVRLRAAPSQVRSDDRPEMIHPAPDCLVGHRHPALREQIFDGAQAQREPKIEPNRLANDLGREPVAGVADFRHSLRLRAGEAIATVRRRDNAPRRDHPRRAGTQYVRLRPPAPGAWRRPLRKMAPLLTPPGIRPFGFGDLAAATRSSADRPELRADWPPLWRECANGGGGRTSRAHCPARSPVRRAQWKARDRTSLGITAFALSYLAGIAEFDDVAEVLFGIEIVVLVVIKSAALGDRVSATGEIGNRLLAVGVE